jgi:hypothetical protein
LVLDVRLALAEVLLDVLFVLPDEPVAEPPSSDETRLPKSDSSWLRLLFPEEVDELSELASSCEISSSILLEKFE